jgi:hypothetical protein
VKSPLKNHFEKLLETTCLHHPYPVKHTLKDCTMMKKFMMSAAPPEVIGQGGEGPRRKERSTRSWEVGIHDNLQLT